MISELITFRITQAKAKARHGVKHLCEHECERSFVPTNIITKAKVTKYLGGINFNLCGNGKVILTKMVALTILDHFGPARLPAAVPRPLPKFAEVLVNPFLTNW